jgi:hypothetical protein
VAGEVGGQASVRLSVVKAAHSDIGAFNTGNSGGPRGAPQIPPLRYASVGMTKGSVVLPVNIG